MADAAKALEQNGEVDPSACPLCGGPNGCAMAKAGAMKAAEASTMAPAGTDMAPPEGASPVVGEAPACWCYSAVIAREILEAVPRDPGSRPASPARAGLHLRQLRRACRGHGCGSDESYDCRLAISAPTESLQGLAQVTKRSFSH